MMPPCSCSLPGMKPGTSTNVTMGMPNASQKRTKPAAGTARHAGEPSDDVARIVRLQLEELPVVDHFEDDFPDVVRLVGIVGHQAVERWLETVRRVTGGLHRRHLAIA